MIFLLVLFTTLIKKKFSNNLSDFIKNILRNLA